ncbi:hypothetical protein ACFQZR_16930 [Paenibacillus sp. GCM10027629]|uniref:hypothetical protein n=1 Tax=Paenibacillus sp. GCM10027629 TaxID=3273414 RepID=UPI0036363CDC
MLQLHPLPRGITGFSCTPNSLILQDGKSFISLLYSILRGTLECEDTNLQGKNYYYFSIKSTDQEYHVLLNAFFPIVAISCELNYNKFIFRSSEEIMNQFKLLSECNYLLLGKEELESDLANSDYLDLDKAELKQIEYWKPKNLSEIVFNNWD